MRIVHIADSFIEGWGYQENLLPLYQKRAGHDVVVVADNDHLRYLDNPALASTILSHGNEYEFDGIKIYKIREFLTTSSTSIFCKGLTSILDKENPDIIFHHNLNVSTLTVAARYKKKHPAVKLYVDNHADWINESKNRLWHCLYYSFLIPMQVRRLGNLVDYYLGVSPLRCDYLEKQFHVPHHKVKFLPIGCDTGQAAQVTEEKVDLRERYCIPQDSFLIVSGGKLDESKGTLELISACEVLRKGGKDVSLILFGKMDDIINMSINGKTWIKCLGWCDRKATLSLLKMADAACWPRFHTTLIEDAIAVGTPLIVKDSDNVSHFSKENAGIFLKCGDKVELADAIIKMMDDIGRFRQNVISARDKFSYDAITKRLDEERFFEW